MSELWPRASETTRTLGLGGVAGHMTELRYSQIPNNVAQAGVVSRGPDSHTPFCSGNPWIACAKVGTSSSTLRADNKRHMVSNFPFCSHYFN